MLTIYESPTVPALAAVDWRWALLLLEIVLPNSASECDDGLNKSTHNLSVCGFIGGRVSSGSWLCPTTAAVHVGNVSPPPPFVCIL